MSRNIFITGTGTDVGKTYVTGLIVKKLRESGADAAYYKAAMSGNERRPDGSLIPGDALQVKNMSGIRQSLEEMCPYVYETAVSPHLASRIEGNPVRMETVLAPAWPSITILKNGTVPGQLPCVWNVFLQNSAICPALMPLRPKQEKKLMICASV